MTQYGEPILENKRKSALASVSERTFDTNSGAKRKPITPPNWEWECYLTQRTHFCLFSTRSRLYTEASIPSYDGYKCTSYLI